MPSDEADVFLEPADPVTVEEKIKRSLFIACLYPCRTVEAFRKILSEVESVYKEANHHCWAYCLGPDPEIVHSSDDGEPSGTAGKPILASIRQSGMVNLAVVVTRYFGGIKLGVRGLIEAYGRVSGLAASKVERIVKTPSRGLVIRLPYDIIGEVTHLLNICGTVGVPEWVYGADVEVFADVKSSSECRLTLALDELRARNRIHSWSWFSPN